MLYISDEFQVVPLTFSKHLDMYNPNIPEWREDIGQIVTRLLAKVYRDIDQFLAK